MTVTITDIATLILAVATTTSLIYISRQLNVTRQQTKGQFLLALDERLAKVNPIMLRLAEEPNFTPAGREWGEIWPMMSIFERINIMVEDGILDVALVDRLYGFALLMIIANDAIYQRLKLTGFEWQDFIDLCYDIADHRQQADNLNEIEKAFIERVHQLDKKTRRLPNPFSFQ